MLDNKVIELLNDQINKELYSAYLYLDIANYFIDIDLDGFDRELAARVYTAPSLTL